MTLYTITGARLSVVWETHNSQHACVLKCNLRFVSYRASGADFAVVPFYERKGLQACHPIPMSVAKI